MVSSGFMHVSRLGGVCGEGGGENLVRNTVGIDEGGGGSGWFSGMKNRGAGDDWTIWFIGRAPAEEVEVAVLKNGWEVEECEERKAPALGVLFQDDGGIWPWIAFWCWFCGRIGPPCHEAC